MSDTDKARVRVCDRELLSMKSKKERERVGDTILDTII